MSGTAIGLSKVEAIPLAWASCKRSPARGRAIFLLLPIVIGVSRDESWRLGNDCRVGEPGQAIRRPGKGTPTRAGWQLTGVSGTVHSGPQMRS
jgi:hypothetical protein